MTDTREPELTFVLEDEAPESVAASLRPEFEEIPSRVRAEVEAELRADAYDLLHAEAVERGELSPPPATASGGPPFLLRMLLMLGVGAMGGAVAVAAATALLRWVTATLR